MRPTKLYDVTLAMLGDYHITVAADGEREAFNIAKTVLLDGAEAPCPGMRIQKRTVDGSATLAEQPVKTFKVHATHTVEFNIVVPAADRNEALRHAQRLYAEQPFPWEHDNDGGSVHWRFAEEAAS